MQGVALARRTTTSVLALGSGAVRRFSVRTNPNVPFSLRSLKREFLGAKTIPKYSSIPSDIREPESYNLTFDPHMQYRWSCRHDIMPYFDDLGEPTTLGSKADELRENTVFGLDFVTQLEYRSAVFGEHAYFLKPTAHRQRQAARRLKLRRRHYLRARISEALAVHPLYSSIQENMLANERIFGEFDPSSDTVEAYFKPEDAMRADYELAVKSPDLLRELPSNAKSLRAGLEAHVSEYDTVTPLLSAETLAKLAHCKTADEINAVVAAASNISIASQAPVTAAGVVAAISEKAAGDKASVAAAVRQQAQAAVVAGLRARVLAVDADLPGAGLDRRTAAEPRILAADGTATEYTEADLAAYEASLKSDRNASIEVRTDDHLIDDINNPARGDAMFALHRLTKLPPIPAVTPAALGQVALTAASGAAPKAVLEDAARRAVAAAAAVERARADPAARALAAAAETRSRGVPAGEVPSNEYGAFAGVAPVETELAPQMTLSGVSGARLDAAINAAQIQLFNRHAAYLESKGEAVPEGLGPQHYDPRQSEFFTTAFPDSIKAPGFRGYCKGVAARMASRADGPLRAERLAEERRQAATTAAGARDASIAGYARAEPADAVASLARQLSANEYASGAWSRLSRFSHRQLPSSATGADIMLEEYRENERKRSSASNAFHAGRVIEHHNKVVADELLTHLRAVPDAAVQVERVKDRAVYQQVAPKVRRGVSRAIHQRIAKDLLDKGYDARHVERLLREYQIDYSDLVQA